MSKSGVPVVSQVAEAVNTIGSSVGDIFSGKNVFESLGRIVAAPASAALDLANDVTFHTLEKAPLGVGELFSGGSEFAENPYSREAVLKLGGGALKVGATVAGATIGAPVIGGVLGTGATTSAVIGGTLGQKLASGANFFDTISPIATQGLGNLVPDLGVDLSGFKDIAGGGGSRSPAAQSPRLYSNNVISPSATSSGNSGMFIILIIAGIVLLLIMRKK